MRKYPGIWVLTLLPVLAMAAAADRPDWAYPVRDPNFKAPDEDAVLLAAEQDQNKKDNLARTTAPNLVVNGRDMDVARCGGCHLPNGLGMPESGNLAGLPVNYFIEQFADFKSGARGGYRTQDMPKFAKNMTDAEVKEVAEYYATLKQSPWVKVVESDTAPQTYLGARNIRRPFPGGATEPIGTRVVEFAESLKGDHMGFIAYVPKGSIAKGEALVKTGGGKTIACGTCHGEALQGVGDIPALAGRSPVYVARQLHMFRNGDRSGPKAEIMKSVVAKLQADDIVAAAAYVGSRSPN